MTGALAMKNDGRNWARIILIRQQAGEDVPSIALEFAREALGIEPPPKREPGDDDVHA